MYKHDTAFCKAMVEIGNGPDFITVDDAEGGTGAAPPKLTNSVGLPMQEGLVLVRNLLVGAGLRDKVSINASGKISSGFAIIRTVALGADITCAARSFMLSLGCIQALKCNSNIHFQQVIPICWFQSLTHTGTDGQEKWYTNTSFLLRPNSGSNARNPTS